MKQDFGFDRKGNAASLYILENDHIRMAVSDHGATLVQLIDKDADIDVVHGFDSCEAYENQDFYIGATIGRTANRIEKGNFYLDGKKYHVPVNNNGNANHGGMEGFDRKMFRAQEEENSVSFFYHSPDGEEGYPGNLDLRVTYRLLEDGVSIQYEASSDADTLFAPTCHSYFNLDGSGYAGHHLVRIHSDRYAWLDENGLTQDHIESAAGTPFDFTEFKPMDQDIEKNDIQLRYGAGYDHYYPVDGDGLRLMAEAEGEKVMLSMYSDLPGMHFYTANWLDGVTGKYGHSYPRRSAICFEAEFMPNAINYEDAVKPVVLKGKTVRHEIVYRLGARR